MAVLGLSDREHFDTYGFLRVQKAFPADAAARMRDAVWAVLAERGIRRDDPATWTVEVPNHLQPLKHAPVFAEIGTARTLGAIEDLLGPVPRPADWGAFFLLFPVNRTWMVPASGWHVDHRWTDPVTPLRGLKVQPMFGDVAPRAGGMMIVAGSHRLVARLIADNPPPPGARPAQIRTTVLAAHPYLRDLCRDGDLPARIARFVDREEEALGIPVRVVELTAAAGDVILIHPLLLHARPTNTGHAPRFLLNKDLRWSAPAPKRPIPR